MMALTLSVVSAALLATTPDAASTLESSSADLDSASTALDKANNPDPATAELLVICNAPDAEVVVDGIVVGVTPLPVLTLPVGLHEVRISAPGYEPYVVPVVVLDGRLNRIEVRLAPQAIWAPIAVGAPGIETGRQGHTPIITRWWFWGVVAVLGAAIVVTGVQLSAGSSFVPGGELGNTDTADWTEL